MRKTAFYSSMSLPIRITDQWLLASIVGSDRTASYESLLRKRMNSCNFVVAPKFVELATIEKKCLCRISKTSINDIVGNSTVVYNLPDRRSWFFTTSGSS